MEPMLSFEISAIDVVLLVVTTVLLLLFIEQKRGQSVAEPRLKIEGQNRHLVELKNEEEAIEEGSTKKQSKEGFQKCVHQFGYLRNMPKNTPVPDECFGCPKVLRCMFPNE